MSEADAYAIQDRLHAVLESAGWGVLAGHKIGCTTAVMQAFLDIHNPCAGGVFADAAYEEIATVSFDTYRHVGVECEIAVRLGRDIDDGAPYTAESVGAAVDSVCAAIEIVDDRYDDYGALGAPTLIADDFFDAGCVLGPPVREWRGIDLAALTGRMRINDTEVGAGRGGDIMGHPFKALAWLAGVMKQRERPLRAGAFVLLGSVVETKWVARGDHVEIDIDRLGRAEVRFT